MGEVMLKRTHSESRYARCGDFRRIFEEDLHGLYQIAFLLTGDDQKAERCFVAGLEDCVKESRVFREWARTWAKRVIVQNAIRELQPRPSHSVSFALLPTAFSHTNGPVEHFDVDAVLGLADFERFVFVLCVLERYREYECAQLLGCSASEVREACTEAIQELAKARPSVFGVERDRERGTCAEALKA
jgi:DNA-directed RNA polymerase specialized sigma24 family protein